MAQTWLFIQGISTTDIVKSVLKSDQNLFIYLHLCNSSIAHDSVTTQSLDLIEFISKYIFPLIWP